MHFSIFKATSSMLAVCSLLCSLSTAVPDNVVASPIQSTDCSGYPNYDPSTLTAGVWLIQIVNSGNSSIEGFSDTSNFVRGSNSIRFGYITFPTRNDIAKTRLQCNASSGTSELQGWVDSGVSTVSWLPLQIAPIPYDATLIYGTPTEPIEGSPVKIFEHFIDGKKQDGIFLGGYDNSTTWGVKYSTGGAFNQDFFYIRLLGPNSKDPITGKQLQDDEFTAFIKIDA